MPRETFQCSSPCGDSLPTHASTGGPPTVAGSFVQSPVGSLFLSSGAWCMQNFVCALQDWSFCLSQSSGSPIIKSHWPSWTYFLNSKSLGWIPRLESLTWGLECSQQCKNFFGIIILQSLGHPPSWYRILFYCD